jgi:hypothetical protein
MSPTLSAENKVKVASKSCEEDADVEVDIRKQTQRFLAKQESTAKEINMHYAAVVASRTLVAIGRKFTQD